MLRHDDVLLITHHYGAIYHGDGKAKADLRPGRIQGAFSAADRLHVTGTALRSAAALGFNRTDIVDIIQTMQRSQFYKSMTSYADHRIWQDVYHVPSEAGVLYVKFTADVIAEFLLLSFKEKDGE